MSHFRCILEAKKKNNVQQNQSKHSNYINKQQSLHLKSRNPTPKHKCPASQESHKIDQGRCVVAVQPIPYLDSVCVVI